MLNEKFSYGSFKKLGLDSDEARKLADELQLTVTKEFHDVLERKMTEIITDLNDMGHALQPFEHDTEEAFIDFEYRDHNNSGVDCLQSDYVCKLRLGLSLVVSAGFGHLVNSIDDLEE